MHFLLTYGSSIFSHIFPHLHKQGFIIELVFLLIYDYFYISYISILACMLGNERGNSILFLKSIFFKVIVEIKYILESILNHVL